MKSELAGRKDETQNPPLRSAEQAFADATLGRLGLFNLQESYDRAREGAIERGDLFGPDGWPSPIDVVHARELTIEAKRAILMNWAWTEYLIDQATNEGMPENGRPSRLDEVEQALLVLEHEAPPRTGFSTGE